MKLVKTALCNTKHDSRHSQILSRADINLDNVMQMQLQFEFFQLGSEHMQVITEGKQSHEVKIKRSPSFPESSAAS